MTVSDVWQDIGAGENFFTRFLRLLFLLAGALVFCFMAGLPLTWPQQAVLGLLTVLMALALALGSDSYLITLVLMMLSMFCTLRYGYWRVTQVVRFFQDPASHPGALDAFFIFCLLFAEFYAFIILFFGYFQTIWPLRRAPVSLPDNAEEWPHIDVIIPTYNEPLDVVRFTALGALNMDWPAEKLHVYILDDGRRPEFEAIDPRRDGARGTDTADHVGDHDLDRAAGARLITSPIACAISAVPCAGRGWCGGRRASDPPWYRARCGRR